MEKEELNFVESGKGVVALVFLHYFGGSSKTWSGVMARLTEEFHCIAVDLPGFGASDASAQALSVNEQANQVADLIRNLHLKRYGIIGHSMGGKIALAWASLQPEGLESLVLVAPSPPTPEPMSEKIRQHLLNSYGDRLALEALVNRTTAQPLPDSSRQSAVDDQLRASRTAWRAWLEYGSREDISPQMAAVRVPVSVISGGDDPNLSSLFLHTELIKYFPQARFAEIPATGHLLPLESPLAVATLIREFIGN